MAKAGRKSKLEVDPTLSTRIADLIAQGLTDAMAYSQAGIGKDTFYRWIRENPDFSDAISRAREKAHLLAVVAFRTGLTKAQTTETTTDTFTETRTRLNKAGAVVPYEYTRTTRTVKAVDHLPDWRAGEAWLKRRDADNWSDKLRIDLGIPPERLELWLTLVKSLNIKPSDIFESMIEDMANADIESKGGV